MTGYIIRRIIGALFVLLMLSFIVFMLVNAVPGNTLTRLLNQSPQGANLTPEQIEQYEIDLGLDKPVLERYGNWLWDAVNGDLGKSFATSLPVWGEIQDRLPRSVQLVIMATLISSLLADTDWSVLCHPAGRSGRLHLEDFRDPRARRAQLLPRRAGGDLSRRRGSTYRSRPLILPTSGMESRTTSKG